MTPRLMDAVEQILSNVATEVQKDASVAVQFAAGHWSELKAAYEEAAGDVATMVKSAEMQLASARQILADAQAAANDKAKDVADAEKALAAAQAKAKT